MSKEDIKIIINEYLTKLGGSDVLFEEPDVNTIKALFNATELTSFKNEVSGWTNSGVQLDTSGQRKYKIEFNKQ